MGEPMRRSLSNLTGTGSVMSSPNSRYSVKVAEKVKQLEASLKTKLSLDFTSVRKAFLSIDENHCGFINAESIARYLGA